MKRFIFALAMLAILCQSEITAAQLSSAQRDSAQANNASPNLDDIQPQEDKLCFRAQGCPNCDSVILLEYSMAKTLGPRGCEAFMTMDGQIGMLKNISNMWGIGGTVFYGGDDCGGRFGFRGRVRHWLNRQIGLDVSPGVILTSTDVEEATPSFSGQVALDLFGVIAPMYQLDMKRTANEVHWNSLLGVRTESYGAPIAFIGLLVLAAATWAD